MAHRINCAILLSACLFVLSSGMAHAIAEDVSAALMDTDSARPIIHESSLSYNDTVRRIFMDNVRVNKHAVDTGIVYIALLINKAGLIESYSIDKKRTTAGPELIAATKAAAQISVFPPLPAKFQNNSPLTYTLKVQFETANDR